MNLKRAIKWLNWDHSICVICSKDFKHCPHSIVKCDERAEEIKLEAMIEKTIKKFIKE